MQSLISTMPVLPIGVSRHFRAAAFVHSVTSPNKLKMRGKCSEFLFTSNPL